MDLRLIVCLLGASVSACSDGCANKIITDSEAPGGGRRAVLFNRDCGATTGFSTQVSLLDRRQRLVGGGNAFRADDDHRAAVAGDWGGPWAEIEWLAPDHLLVRYVAKSRIFAKEERVSDIRITYRVVNNESATTGL